MKHLIRSLVLFLIASPWPLVGAETRDLILVAGQSNAVGYDAYASELPPSDVDKTVRFWWRTGDPPPDRYDVTSGGKWSHLQVQPRGTPLDVNAPGVTEKLPRQYGNFKKAEGGFGPEIGLARTLLARQERPLAIVKAAFSGTGMTTDWNPADAGPAGACYRALVDETKAAIKSAQGDGVTLRLRALVWVQGESDANAQAAPKYADNLGQMLTRLRADLGAPELLALIGVNTRFGNRQNPHMPVVIEQQKLLAERDPLTVYVDCEGAETLPPSHTHFTAAGTLEIGKRYADALLALEAERVGKKDSPQPAKQPTEIQAALYKSLTLHASFDHGPDADFARGDRTLWTAPAMNQREAATKGLPQGGEATLESMGGRVGGAIRFHKSAGPMVFFRARDNFARPAKGWSGTVSFWLKTDPAADLPEGYCDPLQITSKKWDDAAFFVEFEKRATGIPFRLGIYADTPVWNPGKRKFEDIPFAEKPLVAVDKPPFRGDAWTHVAFAFRQFNTGEPDGVARLYLNGRSAGEISPRTQTFTWDEERSAVMLGLGYIGRMDELSLFDRALRDDEIVALYERPEQMTRR